MITKPQDRAISRIPGWLSAVDRILLLEFLDLSADVVGPADVAEIGVYMGKSAAVIGTKLRPGEEFTVVDLFGSSPYDSTTPPRTRFSTARCRVSASRRTISQRTTRSRRSSRPRASGSVTT